MKKESESNIEILEYFQNIFPLLSDEITRYNFLSKTKQTTDNKTDQEKTQEKTASMAGIIFNQILFWILRTLHSDKNFLQEKNYREQLEQIFVECRQQEKYFSFLLFKKMVQRNFIAQKIFFFVYINFDAEFEKIKLTHNLVEKIFRELIELCSFFESSADKNTNNINNRIFGEVFEHSILLLQTTKKYSLRTAKGIFYTQKHIITILLQNSLEKLLEQKKEELKIVKLFSPPKNFSFSRHERLNYDKLNYDKLKKEANKNKKVAIKNSLTQYREYLERLKILDPACGSGFFLMEIFGFLEKEYKTLQKLENLFSVENNSDQDILYIVKNNLYGTDSNCYAIEISKISLRYAMLKKMKNTALLVDTEKNFLQNISCSNFLMEDKITGNTKTENYFDVVIGNPPYVSYYSRHSRYSQENTEEIKMLQHLTQNYEFCKIKKSSKRYNLSMFFLEKGISVCKESGMFAFIVDMNILEKSFWAIRKWISDNSRIYKVVLGLQEFADVRSGQVLLFCSGKIIDSSAISLTTEKTQAEKNYEIEFLDQNFTLLGKKNLQQLRQDEYSFEYVRTNSIIEKLKKLPALKNFCEIFTGVNIGGAKQTFLFDKTLFKKFSSKECSNNCLPFLTTKNFSRSYQHIESLSQYISFDHKLEQTTNQKNMEQKNRSIVVLGKRERFEKNKIFIRQSAEKITATATEKNCACSYSIFVLKNISRQSDFVLLALLNSRLLSYYARKTFLIRSGKGKQPQIRKSGLLELPLGNLNITNSYYVELEKLSKKISAIEKNINGLEFSSASKSTDTTNTDTKKIHEFLQQKENLQMQIDEIIFELFSLTEKEKTIVRSFSF